MLVDFYDTKLSSYQVELLEKVDKKWTPAELLQICGRHMLSLDNAITDIITL